ncbi:MAG: ATP-dependent sacrificial sulfur transferase LarE [Acidimicrobiales bacterium]|jgi:uncharacterized protein
MNAVGPGGVVGAGGAVGVDSFTTASLDALHSELDRLERVVVAFSGGADSAFLAKVANDRLGREQVLCVTAVSPSLSPEEERDCRSLAEEWGLRWVEAPTSELEDTAYSANGPDRCARCKTALMDALLPLAVSESDGSRPAAVVLGVNLDDLCDYRPGQAAAASSGAQFPLVTSGFNKRDVREWSRRLGLRTWDKPAAACLASRVPYGTRVTIETLASIRDAESALRRLGLRQFRVRHHGPLARIEVELSELTDAIDRREEIVRLVKAAGYVYVSLDLEGFRSGSSNEILVPAAGAKESR